MKLKNKRTGEIGWLYCDHINVPKKMTVFSEDKDLSANHWDYNSIAELNEEWEDVPEEPKVGYIIDPMEVDCVSYDGLPYEEADVERAKELGIWFETKEEAEKAVERLRAWKRLKDKGFRFTGWTIDDGLKISICSNIDEGDIYDEDKRKIKPDLDLLFGGEE